MVEAVVKEYKTLLQNLTCNSKLSINLLTRLADENKIFASQIASAIGKHLLKASSCSRVPILYLVDSICKNHPDSEYLKIFKNSIISMFISTFRTADVNNRKLLFKLRITWSDLFPDYVLYALDEGVKKIDPAWPILGKHSKSESVLQKEENTNKLSEPAASSNRDPRLRVASRKRVSHEASPVTKKMKLDQDEAVIGANNGSPDLMNLQGSQNQAHHLEPPPKPHLPLLPPSCPQQSSGWATTVFRPQEPTTPCESVMQRRPLPPTPIESSERNEQFDDRMQGSNEEVDDLLAKLVAAGVIGLPQPTERQNPSS